MGSRSLTCIHTYMHKAHAFNPVQYRHMISITITPGLHPTMGKNFPLTVEVFDARVNSSCILFRGLVYRAHLCCCISEAR